MRPFVLLATRAEDAVAEAEYEAFCRHGGLAPHELRRVRCEAGPLPALDLDAVSGLVLGGSPYDTSAPPPLRTATQDRVEGELRTLLTEALARGTPFFGACYGIGVLGTYGGGVVDRTYGEPVGAARIRLTEQGRADPLLADLPEEFDAYVGHKEACRVLPPSAVLLATSPGCPVQMFRLGEHAYATQFHPELDLAGIEGRIAAYAGHGYFAPDEAHEVLARVRGADVSTAHRVLAAFVRRYART